MMRRSTSADTAARFLAMRGTSRPRAARHDTAATLPPPTVVPLPNPRRLRPRAEAVPAPWRYVESRKPGVFAEWVRDVALPWDGYLLAEGGREPQVIAQERACRESWGRTCTACYVHRGGKWRAVTHHPLPLPLPPAVASGPHIEEHW